MAGRGRTHGGDGTLRAAQLNFYTNYRKKIVKNSRFKYKDPVKEFPSWLHVRPFLLIFLKISRLLKIWKYGLNRNILEQFREIFQEEESIFILLSTTTSPGLSIVFCSLPCF